ncbi:MAG: hypothetical protein Q8M29_01735 [Bacteroidota bacterium]|nr:hypothetical protein [Bacteroidota bacterium]
MKTFVYILALSCISLFSYASGEDSTKTKYDINDPRNPNCPCHKYQKIADEEYQKQIANEDVQMAAENVNKRVVVLRENPIDLNLISGSELYVKMENSSGNELKKVGVKRSVFAKRSTIQHKRHSPKKRKVRFGKKDNSRCTKW